MDNEKLIRKLSRIDENLRIIDQNFSTANSNNFNILKALKKQKKLIRGLRGTVLALSIGFGIIISELMERKRSENYLYDKIEELEARLNENNSDGGEADA